MNIGFEARWIAQPKTGFSNYSLNLLKELSYIDVPNSYYVYLNSEYNNLDIFSRPNFHKVEIKRHHAFYKHASIPFDIAFKKRNYDLFHFLYNAPSLFVPCPFILTMHDVSYKYIPDMLSKKDLISLNTQLHLAANKAERIITISENSKKDIMQFYRIPEDKITVIYHGIDSTFKPNYDSSKFDNIKSKYNLPDNIILYVGTYLPHKNLDTLLYAFKELLKQSPLNCNLVLAGGKGRNSDNILKLISDLELQSRVFSIGFVDDEDLPTLYTLADVFVFPSLYEGFGLPILESMACGTPVIAADSSCLPEIGGNAATYFPSTSKDDLARSLHLLLTNKVIHKQYSSLGLQHATKFTWSEVASKTLNLYSEIAGLY